MTYHEIMCRLMMLASRLEGEGKDLDRQACAEAAGILLTLNSARIVSDSSLTSHPSLNEKAN
jgi:hypothetical protein